MTPNQIRVFKDTKLRANEFAAYTSPEGVSYPWVPRDLLEEVDVALPPEDFSEDTYYRTEQDEAPYVVFTRKSDEQLAALAKSKLDAKLKLVRDLRDAILNRISGICFNAQMTGDTATAEAFVPVRRGLLDITNGITDPAEVDATVMARYAAIVAQCTPAMVSAFAQVDA